MIVMKFGGTSIGSPHHISKATEIISSHLHRHPVVVVSALSGVTNHLEYTIREVTQRRQPTISEVISRHQLMLQELELSPHLLDCEFEELKGLIKGISLLQECSARTRDRILAFGEHCSSKIVGEFLRHRLQRPVLSICSYDLGLRTNSCFGQATPQQQCFRDMKRRVEDYRDDLIVTTGYIAKDSDGNITTLGRNGSDYSATLIGAAIDAEEIQIWTDVSGVMTADPRIISSARPIKEMSFEEASELAYYGAKVIHPSTLLPAMRRNIPVRILNTNHPEDKGTTIYKRRYQTSGSVKSIAHRGGVKVINITSTRMLAQHGFLAKIFEVFAKHQIVVDMVTTSEVSVSLTIDSQDDISAAIKDLSTFSEVSIDENQTIISVVGEGVREDSTVTARVFSILNRSQIPVRMISMGASSINLSFIIDGKNVEPTLTSLHQEFFSGTI